MDLFLRLHAWLAIPFVLALVTLAGRAGGFNSTTAGFLYLIAVLALATWGGWAAGAVASVVATLCFNFFFFPPHGTLNIADPANWVALFSFLIASGVASRLVATARRQAEEARTVVQDGREVHLTPTELAILELLAAQAGKPVTLRQIIARVWKGAPATTADTVRVHVGSLRRKLEPDPANPRYIGTEPWVGYRFLAEPPETEGPS
jgi:K+-sensing histidine kinase KdpD